MKTPEQKIIEAEKSRQLRSKNSNKSGLSIESSGKKKKKKQ